MKRIIEILLLSIVLITVIGCNDDEKKDSDILSRIIIKNLTADTLYVEFGDNIINRIAPSQEKAYNYSEDCFIYEDTFIINFKLSGRYIESRDELATVEFSKTRLLEIIPNRGVLELYNSLDTEITQVKIKQEDDPFYGENILSEPLLSNHEFELFLESGSYLVYIETASSSYGYLENVEIQDNWDTDADIIQEQFVTNINFINHTDADVSLVLEGNNVSLVAGENGDYTFNNAIFVDEDVLTVEYTIEGLYIATTARVVTVEKHETTNVDIIAEGGIVVLKNEHYLDINSALIYPADEAPSGSNSLTTPLEPGDSVLVLKYADDYRVSFMLENDSYETIDTFTLTDNQMAYATLIAQNILAITNQTNSEVIFRLDGGSINRIDANSTEEYNLGAEYGLQVEASYNGLYIFAETENYDFNQATAYDVEITADGGAIFIVNNTSDNITEVYLVPSSYTEWGPDYMGGTITPGNNFAWTIEAGSWDIKIVDDAGYQAVLENVQVVLNESINVDYSDKAKTRATFTNLKNKVHYNYLVGGTRVEGN